MISADDDDIVPDDPSRHRTSFRYYGTLPFAHCDTCGWEGPTHDHMRDAADDGRAHERAGQ